MLNYPSRFDRWLNGPVVTACPTAPVSGPDNSGGISSKNGNPSFSFLNSPIERGTVLRSPMSPSLNGFHLVYAHVTSNVPIWSVAS